MLNTNSYLAKCQQLQTVGCDFPVTHGVRLARGFADYGYEEFYFLNTQKTVSLFTGQVSDWQPLHAKFFFVVPDQLSLLNQLSLREIEIVSIAYPEQREWEIEVKQAAQSYQFTNDNFDLLLIEILIKLYPTK